MRPSLRFFGCGRKQGQVTPGSATHLPSDLHFLSVAMPEDQVRGRPQHDGARGNEQKKHGYHGFVYHDRRRCKATSYDEVRVPSKYRPSQFFDHLKALEHTTTLLQSTGDDHNLLR